MAAVIAAAAQRAERRIVDHLRRDGAIRADRATTFAAESIIERRRLERLLQAHAVVETADGKYWLDEAIYRSYVADRRSIAFVLLGVLIVSLVGMLLAGVFKG